MKGYFVTGKVTARSTGKCRIYVQATNGIWKICKVSVNVL